VVWVIYLTGALQIAGAVGLLISPTRRIAGICLVFFLVAMFPANVSAALNEVQSRGEAPTPLGLRAAIQLCFIGMIWWTSIKEPSKEVEGPGVREPAVEQ
jgi:uncharacterized membrane protein